jgi:hypothetical protein
MLGLALTGAVLNNFYFSMSANNTYKFEAAIVYSASVASIGVDFGLTRNYSSYTDCCQHSNMDSELGLR